MKGKPEKNNKFFASKYGKHTKNIVLNKLKRLMANHVENKYLFILSPPWCGSTLLSEIISTSPFVSVNNPFGTREGQALPTVRHMMFDNKRKWDTTLAYDWKFIKKEWRKYWDITKPILLEKSPPNIIRAAAINEAFPNSFFIIFHRNPYAHCESLMRRGKMNPETAAEFALKYLQYQKMNIELPLNSISISYEKLTTKPEEFKNQLSNFIPEITGIKTDTEFFAHNFKKKKGTKMSIQNLENEKISKLKQDQLDQINVLFCKRMELLDFFNYPLIK